MGWGNGEGAYEVEAVCGPAVGTAHEEEAREHVEKERARPARHAVSGRRAEMHVEYAHGDHNA